MEKLRILINGASGKMGRIIGAGIMREKDMEITAAVDIKEQGMDFGVLCASESSGVLIESNLDKAIAESRPQIMLVFTAPQAVKKAIKTALVNKVACVIGTTGLDEREKDEIKKWTEIYNTPVFIAPNFAVGAVLMTRFAAEAIKYFPHAEIIEYHHDQKLDAPSGTALNTLEKMSAARNVFAQGAAGEFEKLAGSRGGDFQGLRVHSVRLPGFVASQEIVFGGMGQRLNIRHDTINRESFLPGVLLALRKVLSLNGFVFGLENLMD
jgi:4-hydroxy-tetrahydrodipicolinate reductase